MAGVSAAMPPARHSNAFWSVEVDGVEHKALGGDPSDLKDAEAVLEFERRVVEAMARYNSE